METSQLVFGASMIERLESIGTCIGNTPLKKLDYPDVNLFAKLEYANYSGSIKDRAAFNIIKQGLLSKKITQSTRIIESSSGNFAIALGFMCKELRLRFTAVIDPNVNAENERLLRLLTNDVVKVTELDATNGFLLTRIAEVKKICAEDPDAYWTNQYENSENYMAYVHTLGNEICNSFNRLDYVFVAVSSGGTITGLSLALKQRFPKVRIVGVDVEGSMIFADAPRRRHISGIGSSIRSKLIVNAKIDDIVILPEREILEGCNDLLQRHSIFAGASSGAMYRAFTNWHISGLLTRDSNSLFLCPDRGHSYLSSAFKPGWLDSFS